MTSRDGSKTSYNVIRAGIFLSAILNFTIVMESEKITEIKAKLG